ILSLFFFFHATATPVIYTLSLHDALPISWVAALDSMDDDGRRASLAFVAGQQVDIPVAELNEALRRALVVRAVGGSPQRELSLRSEEHTSELQSLRHLVCRLLLEKKKQKK